PHQRWVLSGALCGWGDHVIPRFDLVVFLWVPSAIRLARLRAREQDRYGAAALAPGGPHHQRYPAFMAWAAGYDQGGLEIRSRHLPESWLSRLRPHAVVHLELIEQVIVLGGGQVACQRLVEMVVGVHEAGQDDLASEVQDLIGGGRKLRRGSDL